MSRASSSESAPVPRGERGEGVDAPRRLHLAARRLAALDLAERGLKRRPDDPVCHAWRADLLKALDLPNAIARRGSGWPDLAEACLDPTADIGNAAIESAALYLAQFDPDIDDAALVGAHRAWARRHADPLDRFAHAPAPRRTLRVGYVSADLGSHPVGRLLLSTLPRHDPSAVEIYVYSDRLTEDEITERFRVPAEAWRRTSDLDDAALARRIRDDGIDVLVDLAGHTWGNRLLAFALKPAPVQVSFLGYGATTGMTAMDMAISDPWEAPTTAHFTEAVHRLPSGRLVAPKLRSRSRAGRPVFGSLNKLGKLSPPVIALWARLLKDVSEAHLLLQTAGLDQPWLKSLVADAFAAHGIAEHRLDLRGAAPNGVHLETYDEIDVALDPFPFSGGMTTYEALAAGVPVVTLPGERPLSRQTLSLLMRSGLGDLVARDEDDYVRIAAESVGRMLPSSSPRVAQARELEAAYRQLWEKRLGSRPE